MKRILLLLLAVAFLGSCSTTKTTTAGPKAKPIPPEGVIFTQMENHRSFASIQMPFEGNGFSKTDSYTKGPDGEALYNPGIRFKGNHIVISSNIYGMFRIDENTTDIESVLEGLKKSSLLRRMLTKENVVQQYTDVIIGDKMCKKILVSYNYTREDFSQETYTLGYLFKNNNTFSIFYIDKAKCSPTQFNEDTKLVDSVLKYMVETVEFKN